MRTRRSIGVPETLSDMLSRNSGPSVLFLAPVPSKAPNRLHRAEQRLVLASSLVQAAVGQPGSRASPADDWRLVIDGLSEAQDVHLQSASATWLAPPARS